MAKEPEFLTTKELCDRLRVTKATVLAMIHRKELPAYRVGVQWRVRQADLERYLKRRKH